MIYNKILSNSDNNDDIYNEILSNSDNNWWYIIKYYQTVITMMIYNKILSNSDNNDDI